MLKDRVALVTAAGSGIGRAGAVAMAREGAYVVVTDLREDLAADTLAEIDAAGGRGMAQGLDVRDDAAVEGLIERVTKDHGRLDVLHSHAGIQIEGKVEEVTPAQMDAAWALNVRAHFVASRAVIPHMRAQGGGSVIITASNSGCQYDRGMVSYATTKHAAVAFFPRSEQRRGGLVEWPAWTRGKGHVRHLPGRQKLAAGIGDHRRIVGTKP